MIQTRPSSQALNTRKEDSGSLADSDLTAIIARARAQLYLLSDSNSSAAGPADTTTDSTRSRQALFHSPITSQQKLSNTKKSGASSSECFGLAVSSYEQSLLDALLPDPEFDHEPLSPTDATEGLSMKLVRPRHEDIQSEHKAVASPTNRGFVISMHHDDDDDDDDDKEDEDNDTDDQGGRSRVDVCLLDYLDIESASGDDLTARSEIRQVTQKSPSALNLLGRSSPDQTMHTAF